MSEREKKNHFNHLRKQLIQLQRRCTCWEGAVLIRLGFQGPLTHECLHPVHEIPPKESPRRTRLRMWLNAPTRNQRKSQRKAVAGLCSPGTATGSVRHLQPGAKLDHLLGKVPLTNGFSSTIHFICRSAGWLSFAFHRSFQIRPWRLKGDGALQQEVFKHLTCPSSAGKSYKPLNTKSRAHTQ